jgi:hypothetical protein
VINKTVPTIDISNFPVTWDKTQYKFFLTISTLKDEVAVKVDLLLEGVTVRAPY